jgi:hypothetical protein
MNRHERRRQAKISRIRLKDIQPGPIQHPTLPPLLIARIQRLHKIFEDVYNPGLAGWIEGFQRDMHPENEVIIWEAIARAFETFLKNRTLSFEARKDLLGLSFCCLGTAEPKGFQHLSAAEAQEYSEILAQAWLEIQVETNYAAKRAQAQKDYAALARSQR